MEYYRKKISDLTSTTNVDMAHAMSTRKRKKAAKTRTKKKQQQLKTLKPFQIAPPKCRNQPGPSDCVVTCISMATGIDNEIVMRDVYPEVNFQQGGVTVDQIVQGCKKLGITPIPTRELHTNIPALVVLKGLNRKNALHCVFWDGIDLCDPQRGKDQLKYYTFNNNSWQIEPQTDIVESWELYA